MTEDRFKEVENMLEQVMWRVKGEGSAAPEARAESCVWRLADCLFLMAEECVDLGLDDVGGLHRPTGRGAMLLAQPLHNRKANVRKPT